MLVVSLCKPVIHKLKILGWGRKLEHYKSMVETTKKGGGGGGANFEISMRGGAKGQYAIFDPNLVRENLGGNYAFAMITSLPEFHFRFRQFMAGRQAGNVFRQKQYIKDKITVAS